MYLRGTENQLKPLLSLYPLHKIDWESTPGWPFKNVFFYFSAVDKGF